MGFHGGGWWAFIRHDDEQDRPYMTRELLSRVWLFARPYRWRVLGLLLTILFISGISQLTPLLMKQLIDEALPNNDMRQLTFLALVMVSIPLINGVIGVVQRSLSAQVGEGVIYDLRRALYEHLQRMSLRFFTHTRTGELMSRMNNDVVGAQNAVTGTIVSIVSSLVMVVVTLVIMFVLEWRLTLMALAIIPLFVLPARRVGRILRRLRRQSMEFNAEMNAVMNETLNVSGALLVKLFGRERYEKQRFSGHAADVRDIGVRQAVVGRWFFVMLSVVGAVGTAVIYWVGGILTIQGEFTVGLIVAFGAYLGQLYGPLMALSNAPVEFAQSMVSFERVFEALDIPVEIVEQEGAPTLPAVAGAVRFEGVSFSYAAPKEVEQVGLEEVARFSWGGGDEAFLKRGRQREGQPADGQSNGQEAPTAPTEKRYALRDVGFAIEPGQLVALVGPSGAGKTTITYLLPRLYDPTDGRVLIDEMDIRDVTLSSLSDAIGMVTQDTYLFYDTIRANLLYARPDATDAELVAAARAANIHDFVMSLPEGYETVVGERGYRLSGGERQRMAIARVILKNPRILVLDEATSHLDSLSEALIQEALSRVMRGRTSVVIAHRLATILAADLILVMDKGQLVEQGTHRDLLEMGGLYAQLYETQFRPAAEQGEPAPAII
jgi:ATP-binding cassette subfamily B protein